MSAPAASAARCAGVVPERLEDLSKLGFSGAAMLGAVWQAADPRRALAAALAEASRT